MRTRYIILLSIILICYGFSFAWADAQTDKVISAAKAWLSVIDNGNYSASWKDASVYFQTAVSEQNWKKSLTAVRKPLGALISRNLMAAQTPSSLPGAPDGKYVVMSFKTSFQHKKSAVETVTFMLEKDGKWAAAGYFIK